MIVQASGPVRVLRLPIDRNALVVVPAEKIIGRQIRIDRRERAVVAGVGVAPARRLPVRGCSEAVLRGLFGMGPVHAVQRLADLASQIPAQQRAGRRRGELFLVPSNHRSMQAADRAAIRAAYLPSTDVVCAARHGDRHDERA